MKELIRNLLPYCARHKWRYLAGAAAVLVSNICYVQSIRWVGRTVDVILEPGATVRGVMHHGGVFLGLTILGAIFQYMQRMLLIAASRDVEYEFRNDFFSHLLTLSPSFYDREKTGDIVSRATNDVDQVRMALGPGIMYPLTTLTVVPVTVIEMYRISWPVMLYCFIPMLGLPVLVNLLANQMYKRSLRIQEHFSDFSGRIQEHIAGVRVIRSYAREPFEFEKLSAMNQRNADLNMAFERVHAGFHPLLISIFLLGMLVIVWMSSGYVTDDQALLASNPGRLMTKGGLISLVLFYRNLFFPVLGFGWVVSVFQRASASMHRIMLIWSQKPEIQDDESTDHSLRQIRGDIEFRDLTFAYPKAESASLRGVSFHIPAGRTLGIVGSVGSGKSTVAQLVTRLYDPPPGTVFVDGRDIRRYPLQTLRESVGAVFQETYLFSDTIANNIAFGRRADAEQSVVGEMARLASVSDDIEEFPESYETVLGERGVNLSGGQKQRVSLARALACDPPILVLDDAFASVDTQTEERILTHLRKVLEGRTTILISHRISTVRQADEVIVLDDGEIAERGNHDELVALGGLYADIHHRQLLEEAIDRQDD